MEATETEQSEQDGQHRYRCVEKLRYLQNHKSQLNKCTFILVGEAWPNCIRGQTALIKGLSGTGNICFGFKSNKMSDILF